MNPSASITDPVPARHSHARRAMIGCGAANVSAPPASGRPLEMSCAPSVVRKWPGPGTVLASSISQVRAEGSCMQGS